MSDHDDLPAAARGENALEMLEEQAEEQIRRVQHEGQMWFSVVDVIGLLTDTSAPNKYWTDMKRRITDEGFAQLAAICRKFKAKSSDGKMRETEFADTETLLRIVQSVPSPKAEPFKQWLARVGTERLHEMEDPEIAAERMRKEYRRLGYSDAWINERLKNILVRNELTDEWRERGADERHDFARLTDTLSQGTFDITTAEHRQAKHITKSANLRDSMTPLELVLTSLAEVTATEIHQTRDSQGVAELQRDARDAGALAGNARREVEQLTGKPVVSSTNYKQLRQERQRELQPPLFGEGTEEASEEDGSNSSE